jgi:hypothetical protein
LINYFPLYEQDPDANKMAKPYFPPKTFFWAIYVTLYSDDAKETIDEEREKRYLKDEKEKNKTIMIDRKILDILQGAKFFSKKKGRALFKIKPRKAIKPGMKRHFREIEGGSIGRNTERKSMKENRRRNKRMKKRENFSDDDAIYERNVGEIIRNYPGAVEMEDASHLNESGEGEDH